MIQPLAQSPIHFGKLLLNRPQIENYGPHAWPPTEATDARLQTVDQFLNAMKPHMDRVGENPIDVLDLHGIDVSVKGDHGYLHFNFHDSRKPFHDFGVSLMARATDDGNYEPLISKLFSACLTALDNKLAWKGLQRENKSNLMMGKAETLMGEGQFYEAGRLFEIAATTMQGEARANLTQPDPIHIGAAFFKAADCGLKGGLNYAAWTNIRKALSFCPENKSYQAFQAALPPDPAV